tara:strand:- start:217 stop:474 length:258 start_codon:yes stop_codon:yes gene_type:complete
VIRFYYLVFFLFILIAISLSWDQTQSQTQSDLENLRQDMNKIQSEMQKLRKDLQTEGILPYEEEEDYWKSYEGVSSCEEGVKKCV